MEKRVNSQQGEQLTCDAVIIGSGIAGMLYALELSKHKPGCHIILCAKTQMKESNSAYSQGGIAASQGDDVQVHIDDTLNAADGLANSDVVTQIIKQSAAAIDCLQRYGVQFDKQQDGQFDLAKEGGHSARRIYHHQDITGQELIRALVAAVKEKDNIHLLQQHCAVNLIVQQAPHEPGSKQHVVGAYVLDEQQGLIHTILAKAVVLAAGGAGKVYRFTSNPEVATGDGVAMAYRAGARVGNMEFYQFHPTLLYHKEFNNFLISEALRGEGAYLRLPGTGERFMQRYAPEQMELATRDVIAKAIFTEIETTKYDYVNLDLTHKDKDFLQQRFPGIYKVLLSQGIDMSKEMIPVVPAAHYLCGGVLADVNGVTDIENLYAIGEVAFTGFHGANRLASNSLLEAIVMAINAASHSAPCIDKTTQYHQDIKHWDSESVTDMRRASQINAHWRGLRGEMTSYAGIIRTQAGLEDLLILIKARRKMIESCYWRNTITRDLIELRNISLVAELIVRSALHRRECRGGHYREDYQDKEADSQESIVHIGLQDHVCRDN